MVDADCCVFVTHGGLIVATALNCDIRSIASKLIPAHEHFTISYTRSCGRHSFLRGEGINRQPVGHSRCSPS